MCRFLKKKNAETLGQMFPPHSGNVETLTVYNGVSQPLVTRLWLSGCKQNEQSS